MRPLMCTNESDGNNPVTEPDDWPIRNKAIYVQSTHWDREWRHSFEGFRYFLAGLLDRVVDAQLNGAMDGPYTLDGQSVILGDYDEVAGSRSTHFEELVRAGRIIPGPWFTLPDEFTSSGESLVRNLLVGRQTARDFGAQPSSAGLVCDMFGHISQLPQILVGFGIGSAYVWRGDNNVDRALFGWFSPDESSVLAIRFGGDGYADFAFKVRRAMEHRTVSTPEQVRVDMRAYLEAQSGRYPTGAPILIYDGSDHMYWDELVHQEVQRLSSVAPGMIEIGSLDDYAASLENWRELGLDSVVGELREPGRHHVDVDQQWVIPGVLSSRRSIKKANWESTRALVAWAEPWSAMASLHLGADHPDGFLRYAWKLLLENHAHDSVNGCSRDTVHEDIAYRLRQVRTIADRLSQEGRRLLARSAHSDSDARLQLAVFNSSVRAVTQPIEMTIRLDQNWPSYREFFGYEDKPAIRVLDWNGVQVPFQIVEVESDVPRIRAKSKKFPEHLHETRVTIVVNASVPAMGYTTFVVQPAGRPTRSLPGAGIATDARTLDNGVIRAEVALDGSVTVTDLRSGEVYSGQLVLEDDADIGDGWYHGPAVNDRRVDSSGAPHTVSIVANGPYLGRLAIRINWELPSHFDKHTRRRSGDWVPVTVEHVVTLRKDAEYLEVTTRLDNTVCDHRLRVKFPTGIDAETYLADGAFDVLERRISLRDDNNEYRELETETKPQQSWTALRSERRSLAVVAPGVLESAVRDSAEREILLTLLRCTSLTIWLYEEPGGQELGTHEWSYALVPQPDLDSPRGLFDLGELISDGLQVEQFTPEDLEHLEPVAPTMPSEFSALEISGEAVMTALRQVDDGELELRLFNPTSREIGVRLRVRAPDGCTVLWSRTNFEGVAEPGELPAGDELALTVAMKKIVTLRARFLTVDSRPDDRGRTMPAQGLA